MSWIDASRGYRLKQRSHIPKDWLLPAVPSDLNVLGVPESSGLLSPRELEITNTDDIEILLSNLSHSVWTSYEVTLAYYKRAILAHQLTNCLTEIFIDDALERAKEVDEYLARTGKPIGPLHGLPISLKDQFAMKGLETAMGYVAWIGKVSQKDCTLVEILYRAGAVPFVRTNIPQSLWWGETFNNITGRTLNPFNRGLTSGGSSGGESALIAMKGSPLGVGSDIGGSVRIPTSFTGLYALRPSMHRLPYEGLVNSFMGQESISSVIGPMAPSIQALRLFAKTVIDSRPWNLDPMCLRMPWDEDQSKLVDHDRGAKLCFALMYDNGLIKPTPPIKRALDITKKALEQAGHTVIEWENHKHLEIHINAHLIFGADGGEDIRNDCKPSGEPVLRDMRPQDDEASKFEYLFGTHLPSVFDTKSAVDSPVPLPTVSPLSNPLERHVLNLGRTSKETLDAFQRRYPQPSDSSPAEFDSNVEPPNDPADLVTGDHSTPKSAWELWQLHAERRNLQKSYLDHWMATGKEGRTGTGRPVDAIIAPVAPYAAAPHGYNSDAFYTSMWNALDYPACTFPVTTVDVEADVRVPRHAFHNHEDEHIYEWYNPHIFKDAPVGLQLVGRSHEEEAVLSMTEVVANALKAFK